jgi:hypothetical protein
LNRPLKILVYAPHSAIWVHAFPEALVVESLAKSGHEIVYLTCGQLFHRHCVAMSAVGVGVREPEEAKAAVCRDCGARKRLLRSEFGFAGYDLADAVSEADHARARRLVEGIDRRSYLHLTIDEIKIGQIALYEFLLDRKKGSLVMSDEEWAEYLVHLENTLLAFFAAQRVLRTERPDRVLVYNALYSVNRAICELAERQSIPTYFLHAGLNFSNRLQTLLLGRGNPFRYYEALLLAWTRFRSLPCDAQTLHEITNHFLVLASGSSPFGYSSPVGARDRNVRERFGVRPEQRILVATMSSHDERLAAEATGALGASRDLVFSSQAEWVASLIEYVSRRPDLFLIVRVHPREFPNKREGVTSDHALLLESLLQRLPMNVAVNWPRDNLSVFELASEASVVLNAWSAAGKELSVLGIPVVLYAPTLVAYPPELNYSATTKPSYFAAIEQALAEGWSIEWTRKAYRWLSVEYGHGLIKIADAYQPVEFPHRSLVARALRRAARTVRPLYAERRDCARRPAKLAASGEIAEIVERLHPTPCSTAARASLTSPATTTAETEALHVELARLGKAIFGRGEGRSPSLLERNLSRSVQGVAK